MNFIVTLGDGTTKTINAVGTQVSDPLVLFVDDKGLVEAINKNAIVSIVREDKEATVETAE